jgi:hypothetical protein
MLGGSIGWKGMARTTGSTLVIFIPVATITFLDETLGAVQGGITERGARTGGEEVA